MSNKLNIVK